MANDSGPFCPPSKYGFRSSLIRWRYNVARKNKNLALYEIGKVFEQTGNPKEELPNEINSFAFVLTGLVAEKDFQTAAVPVDFFYAKGILEALFTRLGLEVTYTATAEIASLHPGRTAMISLGDQVLGFLGQVHPVTAKAYDYSRNVCG